MPKEYPFFKFWAKDWSTDETIKLMSRQAKGLYIDMLVHCWIEGSLPADTKSLCKLFGCRKNAFERMFGEFSTHFLHENDRLVCPKLQQQLDLLSQKSEILAENGRKGGSKTQANAKQLLKPGSSITESEPESEIESERKEKDITEKESEINSEITDFPDPSFQTPKSRPSITEILKLTNLVITKYKNTEYDYEVKDAIINLLGSFDYNTLEKAILKLIEESNPDHKYRKTFRKKFINAEAVQSVLDHVQVEQKSQFDVEFEQLEREREQKGQIE